MECGGKVCRDTALAWNDDGRSSPTNSATSGWYSQPKCHRQEIAFTLLEVIIACAIFFMCAFAILGVVTSGLSAARRMQVKEPDVGLVASMLCLSNILTEGTVSGDFELLFPKLYSGYTWQADILEVGSNSLFQVDIRMFGSSRGRRGPAESQAQIQLYRPGSPPGSASKGGNF
jgi:hypothetical protein